MYQLGTVEDVPQVNSDHFETYMQSCVAEGSMNAYCDDDGHDHVEAQCP